MMRNIRIRPIRTEDLHQLEAWRKAYSHSELELTFGYAGPAVETAVASKGDQIIASLTGSLVVALDPLIRDPKADAKDVMAATLMLARTLEYEAEKTGAAGSCVAIHESLPHFIRIVEACGYKPMLDGLKLFSLPFGEGASSEKNGRIEDVLSEGEKDESND
jgi:hypothetical protein